MNRLVFLKLGGSVITNKDQTNTADLKNIDAIAYAIKKALDQDTSLSLLIGHGSGSFGHHAARKFSTREGVHTNEGWQGFSEVALRARELNQILLDRLVQAGISAVSISPFSSIITENHQIIEWNTSPIEECLHRNLVPIIYGDVILDRRLGGTILSTEELFVWLASKLHPERILLAGIEEGIWKDFPQKTQLINEIHPDDFNATQAGIKGSESPDVTGGMRSKVDLMISLIKTMPELEVTIFSGLFSENVYSVIMGEHKGTLISNPKG